MFAVKWCGGRLPLPGDVCRYLHEGVCLYGGRLPLRGDVCRYGGRLPLPGTFAVTGSIYKLVISDLISPAHVLATPHN